MKRYFNILNLIFTIVTLLGCKGFDFQSRRYRHGLYVNKSFHRSYVKSNDNIECTRLNKSKESKLLLEKGNGNNFDTNESTKQSMLVENSLIVPHKNKHSKSLEYVKKGIEDNIVADNSTRLSTFNNIKSKISAWWYLLLLAIVPVFIRNKKYQINQTRWAATNIKKARGLIAVASVGGFFSSMLIGNVLQVNIERSLLIIPSALGIASLVFNNGNLGTTKLGGNKKISYLLLNIAIFFGSFIFGAQRNSIFSSVTETSDPFIMHPVAIVFLTILLVLILLACLYGIAILSCSLACSGSAAAAALVLFGGTYLVTFLWFLAIFNLYKRESKKEKSFAGEAAIGAVLLTLLLVIIVLLGG